VVFVIYDLLVAAGLFGMLFAALEVGFRAGRRAAHAADPGASGQVGAIQGAVLGLLGLLLAFSFAAAGSRFLERQDLIVMEANAIGTAFLRADLIDELHRSGLRDSLRRYTEQRIALSARLRQGISPADQAEIESLHAQIWSAAVAGVTARPATMLAVLAPVNEVIDLHSTRLGAGRKHLPFLVLGLLIACSAIAIGVIGYGCGLGGRRRAPLTGALAILIGTGLWITIDLDHPRAGLMQLSDAPLQALRFETPSP
jgi:hypothetical protein